MAIQDSTGGIGHWIVGIVPFKEHCIERGNGAIGIGAIADALNELWHAGKDTRWVTPRNWRFTQTQTNFTQRHGIPRQ